MSATPTIRGNGLAHIAAAAFIEGMPHAFVAVDPQFNIIAWNPAAERLFGYAAEEVLGRPPTYLPDNDDRVLRSTLGHGSGDNLPGIFTRYRRDGTPIQVWVEREIALRDPVGELIGYGRFIRPVVNEQLRLYQRNLVSQELARAVRLQEVREVLARVASDVLHAERAVVFRPSDGEELVGAMGAGILQEHVEALRLAVAEPARTAMGVGTMVEGTLDLPEGPAPALLVPMGPAVEGWVLALVYPHGVHEPYEIADVARALGTEVWEALRRLELVGDLEAQVEILEATAAVRGTAGLDLEALLEGVSRAALDALSCERVGVYLGEPDALERVHYLSTTVEHPSGETSEPGAGFAVAVLRRGQAVVVQDADDTALLDGPWSREAGAVAVLGLPLRIGDRTLGTMVVAHTTIAPRGFTRLCMAVGDAVGKEAALAIDNARLFANERETVRRLEELDRLKADYVAGITHDLRTPLTLLLGFVRTLRGLDDRATTEERREYLEIMERHALRLTGMVGDLLLSARMEAGNLAPDERCEIELAALVRESVASLDPDRRARVVPVLDDGLASHGDSLQLQRVVQNLVDNALKYSKGAVRIELERAGDDALLRVRDEGPGIPAEDVPLLFTRYSRGRDRGHSGTGLGLSIVRGIVEAHGGMVAVEPSTVGACFAVRLPLA